MSDENKDPELQTWIEPDLEARVVALVVGEASAFEAAELARIIAEKPELGIFKRRIEAVHGLVTAASRLETDPMRLSEERRHKLIETLGAGTAGGNARVVAMPQEQTAPGWRFSWKTAVGIVACLMIVALLASISLPAFTSVQGKAGMTKKLMQEKQAQLAAAQAALDQNDQETAAPEVLKNPAMLADSAMAKSRGSGDDEDIPVERAMPVAVPSDRPVAEDTAEKKLQQNLAQAQRQLADATVDRDQYAQTRSELSWQLDNESSPPIRRFAAQQAKKAQAEKERNLARDLAGADDEFSSRRSTTIPAAEPAEAGEAAGAAASQQGIQANTQEQDQLGRQQDTKQEAETVSLPPEEATVNGFGGQGAGGGGVAMGGANSFTGVTTITSGRLPATGASSAGGAMAEAQTKGPIPGLEAAPASPALPEAMGASAGGAGGQPAAPAASGAIAQKDVNSFSARFNLGSQSTETDVSPGAQALGMKAPAENVENGQAAGHIDYGAPIPQTNPAGTSPQVYAFNGGTVHGLPVPANAQPMRKPLPPFLPRDEVSASDQPYSTFSLHVSDVSFLLARAALAAGQMPDPGSIRPEEFYNAFDYCDPAPAPGEKIACRIQQAAHPILQQRNLIRIAMKVAATGRGQGQPLRLTVLLDTSGSMERDDRAASVRRAIEVLTSLLGPGDAVTLIGFARQPRLLAEEVPGDQAAKLVSIVAHIPPEGGTNMEEAIKLASQLALRHYELGAQNRVVMLTDGAANLGDADPAQLSKLVERLRQQGVSFDACGVGADGLNDDILEALTRKGGGRYYFLNQPGDADEGFARQLAGAFRPAAENVKMQVRFNPSRVGKYRLIGFEKHRLKTEDFRNDKVTAAQLAAEEAAVALYQVQVLPEGEGEVGEVFVRFRDPSDGRMVEQSWTIPYDPQAPPLDKASPAMQLAATSALLAEKLRGGPLADAVDLDALAPVVGQLRGYYARQSRVQDLVTMFEQVRRMTQRR